MDDRLLLFLWVLAGTVLLGGIGACFGGITGAVARGSGMAPGKPALTGRRRRLE